MKYTLIVLSVLMIILPLVVIIGAVTGSNWITHRDYFIFAFVYLVLLAYYFDQKRKRPDKGNKEE